MRYHLNGPNLFSCFWLKEVGYWCRTPGVSVFDGLNQAVSQVSQKAAMAAQPLYVSCYTLTEEWLRELRMPDTKQRGSQHIRFGALVYLTCR